MIEFSFKLKIILRNDNQTSLREFNYFKVQAFSEKQYRGHYKRFLSYLDLKLEPQIEGTYNSIHKRYKTGQIIIFFQIENNVIEMMSFHFKINCAILCNKIKKMQQDWELNINDAVLQFQRSTLIKVDSIYKNQFRKLIVL